jgi:cell wall-associated NlpC family hydrolase
MNSTAQLDPRLHAFRPDLADQTLQHTVAATRYVEPVIRQCIKGVVPLMASPEPGARQVSEIRYGEFLDVFELPQDAKSGFAWVQNRNDHYVGYLGDADALSEKIADLSSRISALRTYVYPEPDVRSHPVDELTLGSYVLLGAQEGRFRKLQGGGYVFDAHTAPANSIIASDYIFTAGRMLHVPYLWGGRTPRGIDCSGLVQLVLDIAGFECPRDSDQQLAAFGAPLPVHWRDMSWHRGDVVFFPGHVGIMTGPDSIIHANAHSMDVNVEPLFDVVMRGAEILGSGRPSF